MSPVVIRPDVEIPDEHPRGLGWFLASLLPYLGRYKPRVALLLAALVLDIGFEAMLPLSLKFIIDDAILPRNVRILGVILIALGGAGLLVAATQIGRDYLYAYLGAHILDDLRQHLYHHLQQLSLGFYSRVRPGEIMARFSTDLSAVENAIVMALPSGLMAALGVLASAMILLVLQWRLAVVAMLGLPLCAIGPRLLAARTGRAAYAVKARQAAMTSMIDEHVSAQPLIKAFGLVPVFAPRFQQAAAGVRTSGVRSNYLAYLMERAPNIGILLLNLGVIAAGSALAVTGRLSLGALVSFQALFLGLSQWVYGLTWVMPHLVQAAAGMQRIDELLAERPQVCDRERAAAVAPLRHGIRYDHVSFSYDQARDSGGGVHQAAPATNGAGHANVVRLSFEIPAGSFVAIIGGSGSGKSTVINLLMRFYDPASGAISWDGLDLRDAAQESLRAQIGVVFQDSVLFNTTLRDNIRMGRPAATDAEVEHAAREAEIHDTILTLPQQYDTPVGERGERLSGGQRQRVAIARALLRSPSVLVLDEATSSLDPAAESAINATLARLSAGRTLVSVTHRLAAVQSATRIIVLESGRVAESGTHQELMARHGVYRSLWEKQTGATLSHDGDRAWIGVAALRRLPMLADLDDALLSELAELFVTEQYAAGRDVIVQGDPGDRFYLVVRGRLDVTVMRPSGDRTRVATLGDGDYFGEIALLQNVPRTASVRTRTATVLLSLARGQFARLLDRSPELRARMMARLAARATAD